MEELNVKDIIREAPDVIDTKAAQGLYEVKVEAAGSTGITIDIPPELAAEGMAREVVHRLQTMRRSAGFNIADHITTFYEGDTYIRQVMEDWADYIRQETLSRQLAEGVPETDAFTASYKLVGHDIKLGVRREA